MMPIRTYVYVITKSDTRVLELYMALTSAAWAIYLPINLTTASNVFINAINKSGGIYFWVGWCVITFVVQMWSIHYKYPKFRKIGAGLASIMWIYYADVIWKTDVRLLVIPIATLNALGCLWILLHRMAVPSNGGKD